jgi:hypothetical protein
VVVVGDLVALGADGGDADAPGRGIVDVLELPSEDDERACTAPPHDASSRAIAAHTVVTTGGRARRGARRPESTG